MEKRNNIKGPRHFGEYNLALNNVTEKARTELYSESIGIEKRNRDREYQAIMNSLEDRVRSLKMKSPTRLCSNSFWDEYLKTQKQVASDAKAKAAKFKRASSATPLKISKKEDSDDEINDNDSGSDSSSSSAKPVRKPMVTPSSAPAIGRQPLRAQPSRATTAIGNRSGANDPNYSLNDPEFDDEDRRRLRLNAMSEINADSQKKNSHQFIKKLLIAKFQPPKQIEDSNTKAILRKKAQREKKQKREEERQQRRRLLGQDGELPDNEEILEKPTRTRLKSRAQIAADERQKEFLQSQSLNPLFLEERTGQELYRVLVQQEIKWTRQAVLESSKKSRYLSRKEMSFFS